MYAVRSGRMAYSFLCGLASGGGLTLFVSKRKYFAAIIERAAISCGEPYKTGH